MVGLGRHHRVPRPGVGADVGRDGQVLGGAEVGVRVPGRDAVRGPGRAQPRLVHERRHEDEGDEDARQPRAPLQSRGEVRHPDRPRSRQHDDQREQAELVAVVRGREREHPQQHGTVEQRRGPVAPAPRLGEDADQGEGDEQRAARGQQRQAERVAAQATVDVGQRLPRVREHVGERRRRRRGRGPDPVHAPQPGIRRDDVGAQVGAERGAEEPEVAQRPGRDRDREGQRDDREIAQPAPGGPQEQDLREDRAPQQCRLVLHQPGEPGHHAQPRARPGAGARHKRESRRHQGDRADLGLDAQRPGDQRRVQRRHEPRQQRRPPVPGERAAEEVDQRRDREAEQQRHELGGGDGLAEELEGARGEERVERAPVRVRLRQLRGRQIQVLEDVRREAGARGDVTRDVHVSGAVAVRPGQPVAADPGETRDHAHQGERADGPRRPRALRPGGEGTRLPRAGHRG